MIVQVLEAEVELEGFTLNITYFDEPFDQSPQSRAVFEERHFELVVVCQGGNEWHPNPFERVLLVLQFRDTCRPPHVESGHDTVSKLMLSNNERVSRIRLAEVESTETGYGARLSLHTHCDGSDHGNVYWIDLAARKPILH